MKSMHVLMTNSLSVALHAWRQPWWGSRGTWRKFQSTRSPPEKLCFSLRSAICSVSRGGRRVSLLLFLCQRLLHGLSVIGCVRAFALVTELFLYDSFQSFKSGSDSVHRFLIGSKPDATKTHVPYLWYVFQARKTLNSGRGLSQFDQLQVTNLVNGGTWFFTEDHITLFFLIVTNEFCAWSTFNFSNFVLISFICSSSFKMASWGTPSTRRSISNLGFFSTSETEFRSSFLKLEEPGFSVVLSPFSVPTASSFLELEDALPESGCSWVSPSAQVEGLRVFRMVFDVLS